MTVFQMPWQDEMPDDDTAFHETVSIKFIRTGLPVHFLYCFGCYTEIIRGITVLNRQNIIRIF